MTTAIRPILRRHFGRPPTNAELLDRARTEFSTNPTIEVYEFEDGEEWLRRKANTRLGLTGAIDQLRDAIASTAKSFESLRDSFANAVRGDL